VAKPTTELVIDVAVNHEFGGDHLADVCRNGALRDAQPGRILESTTRTKVDCYRAGYAAIKYAFLPCVISTSGRLHGEFLRLLYIIVHSRTSNDSGGMAMMSRVRTPSSSAVGNTFGTHAPLSAKLRRGLSPNWCRWRSTPFVATALPPIRRTTEPSRPPSSGF